MISIPTYHSFFKGLDLVVSSYLYYDKSPLERGFHILLTGVKDNSSNPIEKELFCEETITLTPNSIQYTIDSAEDEILDQLIHNMKQLDKGTFE